MNYNKTGENTNAALQVKAAKIAGLAYLLIIIVPLLSTILIDPNITVKGDLAATINNIMTNEILFRINNTISLIMFAGVVILSMALYVIVKPVNKTLAILALLWRFGEAILGCIAVLSSFIVLRLLNIEKISEILGTEQLHSIAGLLLNIHWETIIIVFVFLALGSIIFFYLFLKSKYIPKALSIWGIISYSLVLIGALISLVFGGPAYMILGAQTIVFELIIGFWLLVKGINIPLSEQIEN